MGIENFNEPNQVELVNNAGIPTLEALNHEAAVELYREKVGISPRVGMTIAEIKAGIKDPEGERARILLLEQEEKQGTPYQQW